MSDHIEAVIGKVKKTLTGWDISLMPDNTTWLSMRRNETTLGKPMPGDIVKIRVPRIVAHRRA